MITNMTMMTQKLNYGLPRKFHNVDERESTLQLEFATQFADSKDKGDNVCIKETRLGH